MDRSVMFGTVNSCRERSARLMRNRFGSDGRNRTKMKSQREKQWAHEEGYEMMFDDLVNDPENDITLSQEDVNLVKDLIRGEVFHSKDTYVTPIERKFVSVMPWQKTRRERVSLSNRSKQEERD